MNTLILGCGRVGARLAVILSKEHHVTVLDWNPAAFDRLPQHFSGRTLIGNGIDIDVLRNAHIEEADVFLALTNGDNRNLMAAQVAQHLGVPKVIVRVYDPVRCEIFSQQGLITVSPTITGTEHLLQVLQIEPARV